MGASASLFFGRGSDFVLPASLSADEDIVSRPISVRKLVEMWCWGCRERSREPFLGCGGGSWKARGGGGGVIDAAFSAVLPWPEVAMGTGAVWALRKREGGVITYIVTKP